MFFQDVLPLLDFWGPFPIHQAGEVREQGNIQNVLLLIKGPLYSLSEPQLDLLCFYACNTQQGFSGKIPGLCLSSSAKFFSASFPHHLLVVSSMPSRCFWKDNQLFFLASFRDSSFCCSWYPPSAAFGDCVIVLDNLKVKSSKVVSLWIFFGTFVFCLSDASSYGAANSPRI